MLGLYCPAVAKKTAGPQNGKLYTEEDWNNESKPDKEGGYRYSKVSFHTMSTTARSITRKGAWDICQARLSHMHVHIPEAPWRFLPDICHALCRLKQRRQDGSSARKKVSRWCASTPHSCLGLWWGSVLMLHPLLTLRYVAHFPMRVAVVLLPALLPL